MVDKSYDRYTEKSNMTIAKTMYKPLKFITICEVAPADRWLIQRLSDQVANPFERTKFFFVFHVNWSKAFVDFALVTP